MRILAIADVESRYLWDFFEKSKIEEYDLIISAGDLAPQYLSFLATYAKVPVIYVHGNHDGCYEETPPDGCVCIDDTLYEYRGVRILGLGGSMCYNMGRFQYTDQEMDHRVRRLRRRIRKAGGFDILVTHSPARGIGDGDDLPHRGFRAFTELLDTYQPALFIHGHVHKTYGRRFKTEYSHGSTRIVNAFERVSIDFPS